MKTTDQIIANVLNGEQHAFRVIVNEYQDLVFTLCLKIVRNREVAEEAAQDVFVKVYRKLHQFDQKSSLKTWIYRIAYRTAIDHYRKKKPLHVDSEDVMIPLVSTELGADERLEKQEKSQKIAKAMSSLKKADADVLNLFYMDELKIEEISKIMKTSMSSTKVRLHRARHRLGARLLELNIHAQ